MSCCPLTLPLRVYAIQLPSGDQHGSAQQLDRVGPLEPELGAVVYPAVEHERAARPRLDVAVGRFGPGQCAAQHTRQFLSDPEEVVE